MPAIPILIAIFKITIPPLIDVGVVILKGKIAKMAIAAAVAKAIL
jgi:hypothetical protein